MTKGRIYLHLNRIFVILGVVMMIGCYAIKVTEGIATGLILFLGGVILVYLEEFK